MESPHGSNSLAPSPVTFCSAGGVSRMPAMQNSFSLHVLPGGGLFVCAKGGMCGQGSTKWGFVGVVSVLGIGARLAIPDLPIA